MRHAENVNTLYLTPRMSYVTRYFASYHTYEWSMTVTTSKEWLMSYIMSHMNESCHAYKWVMSSLQCIHIQVPLTCMHTDTGYFYKQVPVGEKRRLWRTLVVTRTNELCQIYEWITSHLWIRHVHTYIYTYTWIIHISIHISIHIHKYVYGNMCY